MPDRSLTGSRIRDRRIDRGIRQSDLAAMVGISPSYLNLIEHNRRRIGGRLLHEIARKLQVDPAQLTEGSESTLMEALRAAAAASTPAAPEGPTPAGSGAELARIEDFAGRFPGWAELVAAQARRIALLEARVAELADRLTHDPEFAAALHQVISAVTSIRSTSSILLDDSSLDADWTARFHRNIYEDSLKLADQSRSLVGYLQRPGEDGGITRSAPDEVGRYLEAMEYHVAALEGVAEGQEAEARAAVVAGMAGMENTPAARLLEGWLTRYAADARALPLAPFEAAARDLAHDPARLAERFARPLPQILRRLASLPVGQGHPEAGLAVADAAGGLWVMKPIAGFALPRTTAACPLWPLFQALGQPGRPLRQAVRLPGPTGARLICYAIAEPVGPPGFDAPPVMQATMLVVPEAAPDAGGGVGVGAGFGAGADALPVGTTCRVCPRPRCAARREPSIIMPEEASRHALEETPEDTPGEAPSA